MIGTPIRGGGMMINYHLSMVSLSKYAQKLGVELDTRMISNCTYIEQGRNVLANTFYESDCTHLIFIDADNGFITNNFFELLLTKKDIVGGLYTRRRINWHSVHAAALAGMPPEMLSHAAGDFPIHPLAGHDIQIGHEPQKVLTMPTGFLCISRHAFETYVKAFPDRKTTPNNPGHYGIQFFRAGTIKCPDGSVGYDTEDNLWCKDLLTLGVNTYYCPWMQISHYGEYEFNACHPCSVGSYVHLEGWLDKQQPKVAPMNQVIE